MKRFIFIFHLLHQFIQVLQDWTSVLCLSIISVILLGAAAQYPHKHLSTHRTLLLLLTRSFRIAAQSITTPVWTIFHQPLITRQDFFCFFHSTKFSRPFSCSNAYWKIRLLVCLSKMNIFSSKYILISQKTRALSVVRRSRAVLIDLAELVACVPLCVNASFLRTFKICARVIFDKQNITHPLMCS